MAKSRGSKRSQGTLFESFLGGFVDKGGEKVSEISTHGKQMTFGLSREPDKPSHKKPKQATLWNPHSRRCSACGLPGHDKRSHHGGGKRKVRRNVDGFVDASGFHPIRGSKGYSGVTAGDDMRKKAAAVRKAKRR